MKKNTSIFVATTVRQINEAFTAWQMSGLTENDMKDAKILSNKLLHRMSRDKALALFLARRMAEFEKLTLGMYRLKLELCHGREHGIHEDKSRRLERRIENIHTRIKTLRLMTAAIVEIMSEHHSSIKKLGNIINRKMATNV